MKTREEVCAVIKKIGIIPAVRVHSADDAIFAANAMFSFGIPIVEITMTIPDAAGAIAELAQTRPELIVGAGTVLDIGTARSCLEAGAAFLSGPGMDADVAEFTRSHGLTAIPGALTPTEVMSAVKAGADFVKIFPCAQVNGPSYIKALKAPFPHVDLIASGGVNQRTAADFIQAGAAALGIGSELIPSEAIQQRDLNWIAELASRFLGIVNRARLQALS